MLTEGLINESIVLNKNTREVVFYGHSLNPQDYSYFQSIFDFFEIYSNNKIKLIFAYSIYDLKKKEKIIQDTYDSVIKLLSSYGDTSDNKDKGKNLLHKLILENRIKIQELKSING